MAEIDGEVAPGFEQVREVFQANFDKGTEVGAAFSAYHRGRKVVDLWGGVADAATGTPWGRDTTVLVFSTTKAFTAVCANMLAQAGLLDLDAPVADLWPSFSADGRGEMPVSHLLSHRAGLPWVDAEMTAAEAFSWEPVIRALETQPLAWEPGTAHGYHALTFGWLNGEVIRRVTGETMGTYLRKAVAEPLGLDLWVGLPEEEEHRVASLVHFLPEGLTLDDLSAPKDPTAEIIAAFMGPETDLGKAMFAPGFAFANAEVWGSREMRAAEVPAANGVSDARSVARLFAACIGEVDGIRLLSPEQLARATTQHTTGPDRIILGLDMQFGLGFMLPSSIMTFGGPRSFGHFGAGGSVGWADPEAELAFGYVMNKMDIGLAGDNRSLDLIAACYAAI